MRVIEAKNSASFEPGANAVCSASALPLSSVRLEVEARGGLARVVLSQRFENHHDEALAVTYSLPLPPDAAISAFAFRLGERRIVGEIAPRADARERFEAALAEGRTAALLDQERETLFTQRARERPTGRRRRGRDRARPAPRLDARWGVGVALPDDGAAALPGRSRSPDASQVAQLTSDTDRGRGCHSTLPSEIAWQGGRLTRYRTRSRRKWRRRLRSSRQRKAVSRSIATWWFAGWWARRR